MRKFEFKNSYEEIQVGDKVYQLSLKDEDRKQYSSQLEKLYTLLNTINATDTESLSNQQTDNMSEEFKVLTLETLDVLFGENAGEDLYKASDDQTEELLPLIFVVAEIIQERREEKFNKYTRKKKESPLT